MKKLTYALSWIKNIFCKQKNRATFMGVGCIDIASAAKITCNAKGQGHEGDHYGIWWR